MVGSIIKCNTLRERIKLYQKKSESFIFDFFNLNKVVKEREAQRVQSMVGFPGQWDEHRRFQFETLKTLGLKPASTILEIGCGVLCAGIPIIEYLDKGNYVGLDVRTEAIAEAYRQLADSGVVQKNPKLLVSESFGREELEPVCFDYIWAFSVLYHLDDSLVKRLFEEVAARMHSSSVFAANVNVEEPPSTWLQFPFMQRSLGFYEDVASSAGLTMKVLGQLQDLDFKLGGAERLNYVVTFCRSA